MHPICHDCDNGCAGWRNGHMVACHCPAGLSLEMARLSRQLMKVADTLETMTVATVNETERATIDAYRLALQGDHDALEAEYNRRCANE